MSRESGRRSVDIGTVNQSLRRGKAKATSDGSTSRGSRGRHSVSSFPPIPDQFIEDGMTDEEFDQIYSGRGDANLPTLDSLFEDIDETGLDNLDGDEEPTLHSNDVDVEAGEHETSRGSDKGISRVIRYCTRRNNTSSAPKSKKGFKGIVSGLLAKKGKRAQPSTSSRGTIESSQNKRAMYQGVPCDYDEDDVEFDVLGWWKQNEHMFPCIRKLARQVLSVLVSTVAVEREFRAGNNILTDFRSCLNAESLETLVCNQDWLLARRRAQESGYEFNSEHYMNALTDGTGPVPELPVLVPEPVPPDPVTVPVPRGGGTEIGGSETGTGPEPYRVHPYLGVREHSKFSGGYELVS
ncbi:hypothetical protein DM860_005362 [Cuscuta australis]|uniref:HAT C-terminal dimerisation domain-containing protein n=1 Tax=Cuscuta australis TaxID=267555 RepID=A0A328E0S3_9ASTE|nr:hypothetical protein DM860_005362 [Cuscuta australis]